MDIDVIKRLIKKYQPGQSEFIMQAKKARNYYRNKTDILFDKPKNERDQEENPLRNADNRIPFNFHGLLVNQKAAYMFTAPPLFDLGNKAANKKLTGFLGDKYPKVCKDLCIDASNCTVGWLHLWKDNKGILKYAVVPSEQIMPVWGSSLEKELLGAFRVYQDTDENTGVVYTVYEYWNDTECNAYRLKTGDDISLLTPYQMFVIDPQLCDMSETYNHGMGEVPFFPFYNNNIDTNDLVNTKPLIDTYCKVFSGFVNDLEDIQEVIFVLTNYGGTDLGQFLRDLKDYKTIQVESGGSDDKSGVSTLTIELPVEARDKLLAITRKCIFEQGQGIDPDPQNFGNSSGVALGFLYSLLELKAGLMETEFKLSFGRFIRCVCRVSNIAIKDDSIIQTWTRTSVKNDLELSQIAMQSMGVISQTTIVGHHPWVEDPEAEMNTIKEEEGEHEERNKTVTEMLTENGAPGIEGDDT
ncbi:phage portal protein [Lacrimispora saccharolytica]|uniref:Phage portal protein, SPP1 family n=1 Tax=Lacrimispora saccharolytica (strain ATCC 35040 / DSM 2544 / NRCC 2533 / WM1) TaxID=610130 RepID=D9R917_LACSW|nr:phage portal protein [Lacrimispora saccharolytica]ADL03992.1 phage portal protein, SPP1 family [[Clostridium] saccharolyticum WM1]QRV21706.1 phage portal protein [Lacrimispora saccharolytica]